jgi:L-lactate dehydrogenase complex protein LldG
MRSANYRIHCVNFISGPSHTGDIEQTIVLGAHGPFRVHLVIVEG